MNIDVSAVSKSALDALSPELEKAHFALVNGTGKGSDFTGWVRLPRDYDREEFARLKEAAAKIKQDSSVLLVVGIGGSYLGARAVIEYLRGSFYNLKRKDAPDVFFTGCNLSASYAEQILELVGDRDFSINVISKSGTTTEPAVAFRFWKALCEKKYGKDGAKSRIYATTDSSKGALKKLCDSEGYQTFVIPDDIGGRYSVLTPVGLLPIAAAGIDIDRLMAGAAEMMESCINPAFNGPASQNPSWQYAAARNALYRAGRAVEILACYDPDFVFMAEWYKQLFGESEGKEGKGIFPASVSFTADLHSMGQFIQEGARNLFETVIRVDEAPDSMEVPFDPDNLDGLNFLAGKSLGEIERQAFRGTYLAHMDGDTPNLVVSIDKKDAFCLGKLIYFFEFACGLSGYLLGVNPFDQPGVEAYKKNMFALLGKPGYEEEGKRLAARL